MIIVNQDYNDIITNGGQYEWQVLNGNNVFDKTVIVSGNITSTLFREVSVGNANAAQLDLTLRNVASVDRDAPLQVQFRATTWDGSQTSAWYTKGWYYIDTLKSSPYSEITQITAFDALMKANQPYQRSGEWQGVQTHIAVNKIANDMGVTMDASTTTIFSSNPYDITVLEVGDKGTTERELLEQIAAAYGGNFFVDENNELQFFQMSKTNGNIRTANVGDAVVSFDASAAVTIQRARLWVSDETYYLLPGINIITQGSADIIDHDSRMLAAHATPLKSDWDALGGYCVDLYIPWGTYEMVTDVFYNHLEGKSFIPYEASGAFVDPKYGLWDWVEIKDVRSRLVNQTIEISPLASSDLSIEHEEELNSQYPYISSTIRRLQYQVAQNSEAIETSIPQRIAEATSLITGGYGGYVKWNYLPDGTPSELLFMDNPNEDQATYIMRLNRNGIGFSRDGGQTYGNAWTIDGKLNADNIATGTIQDNEGNNFWNLVTGEFNTRKGKIGNFTIIQNGLMNGSIAVGEDGSLISSNSVQYSSYNTNNQQTTKGYLSGGGERFEIAEENGSFLPAGSLTPYLINGYGALDVGVDPTIAHFRLYDRDDTSHPEPTHFYTKTRFFDKAVFQDGLRGNNEQVFATASTSVTITSQTIHRFGNYVSGYIRFTTSATINAYGYICTGLPAFATPAVFTLYDQYNGLKTSPTIYADFGNEGLRVGAANLTAGTYNVYFSYITSAS